MFEIFGGKNSWEWTIGRKMTRQNEHDDQAGLKKRGIGKGNQMKAEIQGRGGKEALDIPGLPSGHVTDDLER